MEVIDRELERIRTGHLSSRTLAMAKKQYIGQITIAMESNEGYMLSAARSYLVYDNIAGMDEICKKIRSVTLGEITETANEIYGKENLSALIYR